MSNNPMRKIRMVDLLGQYQQIKPEIDAALEEVLRSTAFIQGPPVSRFANALAEYLHVGFVIPCANGTDALQIALMALGLKPGDEVILPVHTYVATAEVIALLGLTPVFIDVDEQTFNIDINQIQEKITSKTKAIVPVHLYGQSADMEPIMKIAASNGLFVIEDAAQALGATYTFSSGEMRKAGTIGHIGTTSFFPSKSLGCFGDGGAIFTSDQALAEKLKMISNHGQRQKYHHEIVGVNSRLDTIQAAILNVKLKYLDQYISKRIEVANGYDRELGTLAGVSIPFRSSKASHSFHQYTIKVHGNMRDKLKGDLETAGVPTMIYYPVPLHLQTAYKTATFGEGSFPITERLSREVLSLPIHTEMTADETAYICSTIKQILKNA